MSYIQDTAFGLLASIGMWFAKNNSDGYPEFVFFDNAAGFSNYISILEGLFDTNINWNAQMRKGFNLETDVFTDGHVLFCLGGIYYTPAMRSMDIDFGILPFPKWDEAQNSYIASTMPNSLTLTCVPITNVKHEETAAFLDYYTYLGYKLIRPAFYDVLLQGKVVRDDESGEMLDFIFNNQTADLGAIFNIGDFPNQFMLQVNSYNLNLTSFGAQYEDRIQKDIDKIIDMIDNY